MQPRPAHISYKGRRGTRLSLGSMRTLKLRHNQACSMAPQKFILQGRCSDGKESAGNAGDGGSFPGSGRSPGEGNGNPLQYSSLGNPINRGCFLFVKLTNKMVPRIPALAWFQPSVSQILAIILFITMIKCENRATEPSRGYVPADIYAVTPHLIYSVPLSLRPFFA